MDTQQSIDIEGITYVIQYRDNAFIFYIDVESSKWHRRVLADYYSSMDFGLGENLPSRLFGKTPASHIFRIRTFVRHFIEMALKAYQPFYFSYTANEDYKIRFQSLTGKAGVISVGYDSIGFLIYDRDHDVLDGNHLPGLGATKFALRKGYDRKRMGIDYPHHARLLPS